MMFPSGKLWLRCDQNPSLGQLTRGPDSSFPLLPFAQGEESYRRTGESAESPAKHANGTQIVRPLRGLRKLRARPQRTAES